MNKTVNEEIAEDFEQDYRNIVIAAARLHVAQVLALFEETLLREIIEAVDRGDFNVADVIGYTPGNHQVELIQGHFKLRVTGTLTTEGGGKV